MSEKHYSKRSFDAVLVRSEEIDSDHPQAGQFCYVVNAAGEKVGLQSCLPNAGDHGDPSWGVTMFKGYGTPNHEWTWDGNIEKPTLKPSIHRVGHWHGWLRSGRFVSC